MNIFKNTLFAFSLLGSLNSLGAAAVSDDDTGSALRAKSAAFCAEVSKALCEGGRVANTALLVVDLQNGFVEDALKDGDELPVPGTGPKWQESTVADMCKVRETMGKGTVLTGDWHPEDHVSFAGKGEEPYVTVVRVKHPSGGEYEQRKWPVHCVAGTPGADFLLDPKKGDLVWHKGTDSKCECYSAATDELGRSTGFVFELRLQGIKRVLAGGLAADICVAKTIEDLAKAGIEVFLVREWTAWVNKSQRETDIARWEKAGISVVSRTDLGV